MLYTISLIGIGVTTADPQILVIVKVNSLDVVVQSGGTVPTI